MIKLIDIAEALDLDFDSLDLDFNKLIDKKRKLYVIISLIIHIPSSTPFNLPVNLWGFSVKDSQISHGVRFNSLNTVHH